MNLPTLIEYKSINSPPQDILLSVAGVLFNLDPDSKYLLKAKNVLLEQYHLYVNNASSSASNLTAENIINQAKNELDELQKVSSFYNLKTLTSNVLLYALIGDWKILAQEELDSVGKEKLEAAFRSYSIQIPQTKVT
ncbi:hypothetical protein A2159_00865 [Candidatus Woesebacteria bacterium RBG_13_34_9]|uniref:Uncharacterized protein n=1 Tax=Candidatus Woesebacteria bacterium RBG_13_34_9 TaxID=1802477 RepID=A0A1F7X524_9BACT|nr:MAG: hypothetical protein A2159_00865 [Candidatus Woesebacteria bacterium RBG_13_34_9]